MVIRELTYQLHKLEASESALVSADHHDKKSVLGIGGKNPDRSIPSCFMFVVLLGDSSSAETVYTTFNYMFVCLYKLYDSFYRTCWSVSLQSASWLHFFIYFFVVIGCIAIIVFE